MIKVPNSEKPTGPKSGISTKVKDAAGMPSSPGGGKTTQSKPIAKSGDHNTASISKTFANDPNEKRSTPNVKVDTIKDGPRFGRGKK